METGQETGKILMETTKKKVLVETGNKNGNRNRNWNKKMNWKRIRHGTSEVKNKSGNGMETEIGVETRKMFWTEKYKH